MCHKMDESFSFVSRYYFRVQSRTRLCTIDAILKKLVQPNRMSVPEGRVNVAFGGQKNC